MRLQGERFEPVEEHRSINERFAMDIPPFDGSPDNTERVFEQISRFHKFTHPKHRPDLVTPRPSSALRGTADRFRSELEQPRYAELMADARDLYEYYLEKIEEQCAAFERISMSQSSAHAGSTGFWPGPGFDAAD